MGLFSLTLILINGLLMLLHLFQVIFYFYTVFYALFSLWAFLMGLLGWAEYDKNRMLAIVGTLLGGGMFLHWLIVLVISLTAT